MGQMGSLYKVLSHEQQQEFQRLERSRIANNRKAFCEMMLLLLTLLFMCLCVVGFGYGIDSEYIAGWGIFGVVVCIISFVTLPCFACMILNYPRIKID